MLVALLLTAWFAVMLRNDVMGHAAADRLIDEPDMSAADWDGAMQDLQSAQWLDPSNDWRLIRGQYLLWRDRPQAARLAVSVLREEPDSLNAWWLLRRATLRSAPRRAEHAMTEIKRLNPTPPLAQR
jgi:hypothetical protein